MRIKEIEKLLVEAAGECVALRIPISEKISSEIQLNKRARSRFASCKKVKKGSKGFYIIEVSEMLLDVDTDLIKEILAHELLHTCPDCYNHGKKWKFYAAMMNQHYGYNIKTATSYESLGIKAPEVKREVRYVITCQNCGQKIFRQKKSKLVTNTRLYRCKCGGKLICEKTER